ncbi:MAG: DNA gyrase/topoisomerase IV subunit A, partial [Bacteroidales bacterium]|nr:DNA gyrase/topoisomerase IV subunit A [Bacteroidales bacterium]
KYNDGQRGGKVMIRAKIEKLDKKTLVIREIPYGQTTGGIIETILKANEKGKIKIKKVDDNTAEEAEIVIELQAGISADVTIDALYAFTNCQISISPNACVIEEDKPRFASVTEILESSVRNTLELLRQELKIKKNELEEQWHYQSLEKWFIEKRIYKEKAYENANSNDEAIEFIASKIESSKLKLIREVTKEDILKLLEIKMKRILRFNINKADEDLNLIVEQIKEVNNNLENIVDYTIEYYKHIKEKYGEGRDRKTEIRNFDSIDTVEVAVANAKLYVNREEGFVGCGLKKDEYVCDCSDIDDIIVIREDGKYQVSKVSDKAFFGKGIIHVGIYRKNDKRTIYNVVYRDGKSATSYIKRFAVTNVIRDKEYDITKGTPQSKILYFSANANGEAEVITCKLKPKLKLRKLVFDVDFKDVTVKNRDAQGNIFARTEIHKVSLKEEGYSTLGGRKIWFDRDVMRLNVDERGQYLGEFAGTDKILVVTNSGDCIFTNFDLTNHYNDDISFIEKYVADRVFTAIHFDAEQKFFYLKRFNVQEMGKPQSFISEYEGSYLVDVSEDKHPQIKVTFGGKDENRQPEIIDAEEFIAVKGITARGKRITTYQVKEICFIEPLVKP